MLMKKPWIEKLFFMVPEFMGFLWGFLNSCPIKKPWVFRERLNINGSWKMKWLLMAFSLPMNYAPGLLFTGKTETWPPWKLFLNYFRLLNSIHRWGFFGWLIWNYIHVATTLRPSQFNALFPIARPTHFFGKVKKKRMPESLVKKQVI